MAVIQWSPAAWGSAAPQPASLPRSFNMPMPLDPLVRRDVAALLKASPSRTRLWEITSWMHCSIIGTCLSTTALHHLLVKLRLAPADVDDHAAHKIGVTIAARSDVAGKLLHKTLDTCHRLAINRFARAHTEDEVRALWRAAVDQGDIPGAYWAVMTHPASSRVLLGEAFGDVHMLSHLVGAANRADIRRLRALEAALADHREKLARQQSALRDAVTSRDAVIDDLRATLARQIETEPKAAEPTAERTLHALVRDLEDRLHREAARRQTTDQKLATVRAELQRERGLREVAERDAAAARADLAAIDLTLEHGHQTPERPLRCPDNTVILYVGGRPHLLAKLRGMVAQAGATLLDHDGGLEDNDALLASLIARADVVMFPVDCVSHRAVGAIKRGCEKSGRPFIALRSASASAFLAGMARWTPAAPADAAD